YWMDSQERNEPQRLAASIETQCFSSSRAGFGKPSIFQSTGNQRAHRPVTASVATPPMTTDLTVPHHLALRPDSKSPSSFEAPMDTALTGLTRPGKLSGVSRCTSRWRTYTLPVSAPPRTTSASNESAKLVLMPNTIVATPNMATPPNVH